MIHIFHDWGIWKDYEIKASVIFGYWDIPNKKSMILVMQKRYCEFCGLRQDRLSR